ncbi:Rha family transcriptional regulator [Ruminococcus intestinalis]|uniref:Rha family transcriptional regulator n=1 Tax=Ruminococcus intestinalis TaxID=2763066 RepID=UPI003F811543
MESNLSKVGETINAKEYMTSREIAEIAGRNHKDVMRSIRDMEDAWVKVNGRNFALVEYTDIKG